MSTPARHFQATVLRRQSLSPHLIRLVLGGSGLAAFTSTAVPDEWIGLVVPGQFQVRYYTVRSWLGGELTLDVVVHAEGLVTEWAMRDCVGETVIVTEPKASFELPADAGWLILVGDLTAMPAMARIVSSTSLPTHVFAEFDDNLDGYLPARPRLLVDWLTPPAPGASELASVVQALRWPEGAGYFWMAGESGQMRAIRKHLMRERRGTAYDVMGYWRGGAKRQPRAVDPGPYWRAGKAAGKSDAQIWADYDEARDRDG